VHLNDLWALNDGGELILSDQEARESLERCVREMEPEALARILEMRPFRYGENAPSNDRG